MHAGTPIHTISSDHVLHANPVKTDIFFKYETHEIDLTHLDSLFYHFSFQKGIKTKGKLVRFVLSFTSSPVQCDQMLILKVTHFFPKVAQKVATVVFSSKIVFCKKHKIHQLFGLLLEENLPPRTFKNRPIWSHWSRRRKL